MRIDSASAQQSTGRCYLLAARSFAKIQKSSMFLIVDEIWEEKLRILFTFCRNRNANGISFLIICGKRLCPSLAPSSKRTQRRADSEKFGGPFICVDCSDRREKMRRLFKSHNAPWKKFIFKVSRFSLARSGAFFFFIPCSVWSEENISRINRWRRKTYSNVILARLETIINFWLYRADWRDASFCD